MLYSDRNTAAAEVYDALGDLIYEDMRDLKGVHWWEGLELPRNLLIADYLAGLTDSVQANLDQASMHLARTIELSKQADTVTRFRMTWDDAQGRDAYPDLPAEIKNMMIETQGHLAGFLRAVGSVLDNLAGIIVGTGGMNVDIVRASWLDFTKWQVEPTTAKRKQGLPGPHIELIDETLARISKVINDGPTDWIEWSLDYRNTVVHRAARTWFSVYDSRGLGFNHPLPRHPDHTHAESLARGRRLVDDLIGRDLGPTLELIFDSALALAVTVGRETQGLWNSRQQSEDARTQPRGQWPKYARGRELKFQGDGESLNSSNTELHLSPRSMRRLRVARLLDLDANQWRTWMRQEPRP